MHRKKPQTAKGMLSFGQHFAVIWGTPIPCLVRLQASRIIKAGNDFGRCLAQPPVQSRVSYDQARMITDSSSWVLKFLNDGGKIYFKATYRPSLLNSVAIKPYKIQTKTLQFCRGRRCTRLMKEAWSVCLVEFWPNWPLHVCGQNTQCSFWEDKHMNSPEEMQGYGPQGLSGRKNTVI